jgi:uncharacterized membrane protein HdeD (DUF308 family)
MLPLMESRTAETVSAESVSQAGAGGLLSAVGLVELVLGLGGGGWPHRAGAAMVVLIGAVLLARGILAIVAAPDVAGPEHQAFAGAARSSASSAV